MQLTFLNPSKPFENRQKWYIFLFWALTGGLCAAVLTWVFNRTGLVNAPSYQEAAKGLLGASSHISVLVLMYCLMTPVAEEIIFRFLIYGYIFKKTGSGILSVVATALLFGLYHLNPVQMLYGFLMGLVITYGYHHRRNLLIPILAHSAANAVALMFTFMYPLAG